jgi:hypothetical protein
MQTNGESSWIELQACSSLLVKKKIKELHLLPQSSKTLLLEHQGQMWVPPTIDLIVWS